MDNEERNPEIDKLKSGELSRDTIKEFMKYGEEDDAEEFLKSYFDALGDVKSLFFRQYIVTDLYVGATFYLETLGLSSAEIEDKVGTMQKAADALISLEQTKVYCRDLVIGVIRIRKERLNENK